MSAARRRARNALDKCPGYEPNPMFLFLERCKNCGFAKTEHSKIQSEGSTLFSYLGVENGIQQAREVLARTPVVQNYLPKEGGQAKFRVVKRVSEKRDGKTAPEEYSDGEEGSDDEEVSVREQKREESPQLEQQASFSLQQWSPFSFFRTGSAATTTGVLESQTSQSVDSEIDQGEVSEGQKSRNPSFVKSRKFATHEASYELKGHIAGSELQPEAETSTESSQDEEEVAAVPITEVLRQRKPSKRIPDSVTPSESFHPHGAGRPTSRAVSQKVQHSQHHSSSASSSSRQSVTQFVLSKVRPSSHHKSNKSSISLLQGVSPADMKNSRQAHLDQIRLLMNMTDSRALNAQMHFRRYEEPSLETLKLYKSPEGRIAWKKKMTIGWSPIHVAAWNRDEKVLTKLIRQLSRAQLNVLTVDCSESALSIAVKRRASVCVSLLVSKGADVNAADTFGFTPLHYAVRAGDAKIVRLLLENNAVFDVATTDIGHTTLHLAARYADLEIIDMLLAHNLDVNVADKRGWTPLFYACMRHGKSKLVDALMDRGASVNWKGQYNLTPLHCAVVADDPDILPPLIERGARMDAVDANGWTPVHYCARYDAPKSLQTLLEFGARPSPKIESDIAPFDIALHFEYDKIIMLLEQAPGFKEPTGDRSTVDCEDSCIGIFERTDTEMDLAELGNIRSVLVYSVSSHGSGGCCVIS